MGNLHRMAECTDNGIIYLMIASEIALITPLSAVIRLTLDNTFHLHSILQMLDGVVYFTRNVAQTTAKYESQINIIIK